MKDILQRATSRWRKWSRGFQIGLLVLILLLVSFRLALPHLVHRYVNHKLDELPEYDGRVGDVDIQLFRGAYSIQNVDIVKTQGKVPVPFFSARRVDFSMEWRELVHGSLVGEVEVFRGKLNFIKAVTREDSQTQIDKSWIGIVQDLSPFKINRFSIHDGEIWFRDFSSNPTVDLFLTNANAVATNLSNARNSTDRFPAGFTARGVTIGGGDVNVALRLNPLAAKPTFDLNASARGMDLVAFNDFLEAYARVDVKRGTLEIFAELVSIDGKFEGYVKPLLEDLDVFDLKQDKNPLEWFWEGFVASLVKIFKNHSKDQVATKIPISGDFSQKTDIGIWETVAGVLKNAFVKALPAKVDNTINPGSLEKKKKE